MGRNTSAMKGGWNVDRINGVLEAWYNGSNVGTFKSGRIMETLTTTNVDGQNNTISAAQILGGIVVHTSATGSGTATTDTAANIIAGVPLTKNGQAIVCYYINDGDQTITLAGGSSVTVSDTGQTIGENESAVLVFVRASSTTVTCHILGA